MEDRVYFSLKIFDEDARIGKKTKHTVNKQCYFCTLKFFFQTNQL